MLIKDLKDLSCSILYSPVVAKFVKKNVVLIYRSNNSFPLYIDASGRLNFKKEK